MTWSYILILYVLVVVCVFIFMYQFLFCLFWVKKHIHYLPHFFDTLLPIPLFHQTPGFRFDAYFLIKLLVPIYCMTTLGNVVAPGNSSFS